MWRGIAVLLVAVAWGACGAPVVEVTPDDEGASGTSGTQGPGPGQPQPEGETSSESGSASGGDGTSGSSVETEGVGVSSTSTSTSTSTSASASGTTGTTGSGSTTEGAGPSCDELFGAAPDYILCEETPDSCSFNAKTDGNCNDMCASLGGTCLEAFDNPSAEGEECDAIAGSNDDCTTNRQTEVCVCSKP